MPLDVEIGKQNEHYIVRYIPLLKIPERELKPLIFSNLTEERLYTTLRGLKDIHHNINLKPLTRKQGIDVELSLQEIRDISDKL